MAAVPEYHANQRLKTHIMLSHNPTLAVTPGIPPTSCLNNTMLACDVHNRIVRAPMFSPNLIGSMVHCATNIPHILTVVIGCSGHQVLWT